MKLPFPFTNSKNNSEFSPTTTTTTTTTQRPWRQCLLPPACMKPKTHSFRSQSDQPWASQDPEVDHDHLAIAALQSERLFYNPEQGRTSSIMEEVRQMHQAEGAVAEMVVSVDPRGDFRRSMEEMVALEGAQKDWGYMEDLLSWYLHSNSKMNHGFIIAAFTEMLLHTVYSSSSSSRNSVIFSDATPPLFSTEEEGR